METTLMLKNEIKKYDNDNNIPPPPPPLPTLTTSVDLQNNPTSLIEKFSPNDYFQTNPTYNNENKNNLTQCIKTLKKNDLSNNLNEIIEENIKTKNKNKIAKTNHFTHSNESLPPPPPVSNGCYLYDRAVNFLESERAFCQLKPFKLNDNSTYNFKRSNDINSLNGLLNNSNDLDSVNSFNSSQNEYKFGINEFKKSKTSFEFNKPSFLQSHYTRAKVAQDLMKKSRGRSVLPGQRRPRKMFSDEEVNNLIRGVEQFGEGKWARILQFFEFDDRTAVDLKDKWRNLQKPSSTVKVPKDRRTRLPYTEIECRQLRYGVQVFGHNWVAILRAFSFNSERTPVDLKDKWRNLQIKSGIINPPAKKKRRFLLLDSQNQIFKNVYPRDAALKAAARGFEYIKLLQIGTPRIHVFAGERKLVHRYIGREKGSMWKGRVLKLGMERATVAQLRVAKANFASQFGVESAHDIAPNVNVDPLKDLVTSNEEVKEIFTSKIDKKVMNELKIKKEKGFYKEESEEDFQTINGMKSFMKDFY